ncbi:MAG TPA: aconitase family protein, partial [Burkholderiaceae bacterium]|nr:aconitase family protein [Burkholderiaceae bacterium]
QVGLIAPDAVTRDWLVARGVDAAAIDIAHWHGDPGSADETHAFDASTLAPQVALPHSPANVQAASGLDTTPVDVAYIGACTGAKLDDLRAAARVLKGRKIASGVQLLVAPASVAERGIAEQDGTMAALIDAGATVLPSACGACAGYGGAIPDGSTVISSTARNFQGRMGSATARVFLGSPYTVAASALRGRISDAREMLA